MAESKSIPVRFPDEMLAEMEQAAQDLHLQNRTDLIKVAVRSLLDYIEKYGPDEFRVDFGRIMQALVAEMDRRKIGKAAEPHSSYVMKPHKKTKRSEPKQ